MKIGFTIAGACRTKKTSQRFVQVGKFQKILPSRQHEEWFNASLPQGNIIRNTLIERGVQLPFEGPVTVKAIVFRDAAWGDWLGFMQAIADLIQEPRWSSKSQKQTRKGIGLIRDDVQIVNFDGSYLTVDKANPRIEVTIAPLGPEPGRLGFAEEAAL
jgi:hypothetical protein